MPRGKKSEPAVAVAEAPPEAPAPEVKTEAYFVTFAWHGNAWKHRMTNKTSHPGFGRVAYAGEMCQAITVEVQAFDEARARDLATARIAGITS